MSRPFWQRELQQLTKPEWEALCDGCGRCCLHKLEDAETGQLYYTAVACRLLDLATCRCSNYAERHQQVADCIRLDPAHPETFRWLPESCAYRCLAEGRALPPWHPLLTGNRDGVLASGTAICAFAVSENDIEGAELEMFLLEPVE